MEPAHPALLERAVGGLDDAPEREVDELHRLVEGRLVGRTEAADGPAISMLPPLLNAARFVAVLAAGPEPASGLVRAVEHDADPAAAPIRSIRPQGGELKWYVDPLSCRDIMPVEGEAPDSGDDGADG